MPTAQLTTMPTYPGHVALSNISNGHISATRHPIHFMHMY